MNLNARCQSVKELFQNHLETCSSVFLFAKLQLWEAQINSMDKR